MADVSRIPFSVSHRYGLDALSCAVAEERTFELLDGELGDAESIELHAHLQHCTACRSRFARTSRLLAVLRRQRRHLPATPPALRARIRALLAATAGREPVAGSEDELDDPAMRPSWGGEGGAPE